MAASLSLSLELMPSSFSPVKAGPLGPLLPDSGDTHVHINTQLSYANGSYL